MTGREASGRLGRPRPVAALQMLAVVAAAGYTAWLLAGPAGFIPGRDLVCALAAMGLSTAAVIVRPLWSPAERGPWAVMAAGLLAWLIAEARYTLVEAGRTGVSGQSLGQWLSILGVILFALAVALLMRSRLRASSTQVWLDGELVALGTAAFLWLGMESVMDSLTAEPAFAETVMAPLAGTMILTAGLAGILAVQGSRTSRTWVLLLSAMGTFWLAGWMWGMQVGRQSYVPGTWRDALWVLPPLLIAFAAWPALAERRRTVDPVRLPTVPALVTLLCFCLLVTATQARLPLLSVVFAGGALVFGAARTAQTYHQAAMHEEAEQAARTDYLTGLANRRALVSSLRDAVSSGNPFTLLILDLDDFKRINDSLGHLAGDDVLRTVAARIREVAGPEAPVARLGGDEFALLLPEEAEALLVAGRLRHAVTRPIALGELEVSVDVSIGAATAPQHGTDLDVLIRNADLAMYRAKREHAGSVTYDPAQDHVQDDEVHIMNELRTAIEAGDLTCRYQPQLALADDTVFGVEALVDWEHPHRGQLPVQQYLPMVERTALIRPLTEIVLRESLEQVRLWREAGLHTSMSVNISPVSLLDEQFPQLVADLLTRHHVTPELLTLEITERVLLIEEERTRDAILELRRMGVRMAIDDYGVGYSSLAQIRTVFAQEVKLDRSFVTGAGSSPDLQTILRATVEMTRGLGLTLVAEGVETQHDLEAVREAGCDAAQGYEISRPGSAHDIAQWLRAHQPGPVALTE